jgi:RNA-directed DNA polymerase
LIKVNHHRLLAKIAERVSDKRLLKPIRAFLRAGVMENGLVSPAEEGTPQGGPLPPVLSNIVLNQLDQGLERRDTDSPDMRMTATFTSAVGEPANK